MPRSSERKRLLSELRLQILYLAADDACDDDIEEALLHASIVEESRYSIERIQLARPQHFFDSLFPMLPDDDFRSYFRTTRIGFKSLVETLQDHPVFSNNSRNPQAEPAVQIAVALYRLGSNGNGGSLCKTKNMFNIGSGTAVSYTARVLKALNDVSKQYIVWPDNDRRKEIGRVMREEGFPGCIGFIDGTTIPLSQKPAMHGEVYYDRKKRYDWLTFLPMLMTYE